MKILIVEDNDIQFKLIQLKLKYLNLVDYVLQRAATLNEAMLKLAVDKYDIIISDLKLPDTMNYETLEELYEHYPHIPIIVITSMEEADAESKIMQRGASYYISKNEQFTDKLADSIIEQIKIIASKK